MVFGNCMKISFRNVHTSVLLNDSSICKFVPNTAFFKISFFYQKNRFGSSITHTFIVAQLYFLHFISHLYYNGYMDELRERRYWLALSVCNGIGPVRFQKLLHHFGSAQSAWDAPI